MAFYYNTGTDNFTGLSVGSVFVKDIGERTHKIHGPQYMTWNPNFGSKSAALLATLVNPAGYTYSIGTDGFIRLTRDADGFLMEYYSITPMDVKNGYTPYKKPQLGWDATADRWVQLWKTTNIGQNRYFPAPGTDGKNIVVWIDPTGDAIRSALQGNIKMFVDRGILIATT